MTTPTIEVLLNANNPQTVITGANLNNLASGSLILGSAFSNVQSDGAGGGFPRARLKLHIDSMTVSAGGIVDGWFLTASDGSVYEQGSASVTPLRVPDFVFIPVAQTAAVDIETYVNQMPICATIKCLLRNNTLGAATPSNNNGYLNIYYDTDQIVSI